MKKVGVSKEEKQLSYYRFFEQELAPVPEEKLEILKQGPSKTEMVSFEEKDLFLKGEDDDYCQIGFGVMKDGTGFVCNATYMPKVTVEMLDWWFPWHSVGSDLRYKIWDPEDHYFARADRVDYVCDPNVPMREKTWGVSHYIMEDVGPGPCAIGERSCAAAMTHKWYPYKDGVMFCSRFWIGMGVVDGNIIKTLPEGVKIPEIVPQGLFAHNIKEFTNLAAILPQVYKENKDNL